MKYTVVKVKELCKQTKTWKNVKDMLLRERHNRIYVF